MERARSNRMAVVLAAGLFLVSGSSFAQVVYETYTIKNDSEQTANDLHLVIVNSDCVAEPISQARSHAFTDPPDGENTNAIDWDSGGEVPPGASDLISICNEDHNFYLFKEEGTHFTHDGNPLDTDFVTLKFGMHLDRDGLAYFDAESGEGGDVVAAVAVYGGNDLANFTIGEEENPYEQPTGSLILSTSLTLVAGSSLTIPLGPFDPSGYGLILAEIERVDEPGEFFQAAGFYPGEKEVCILALRDEVFSSELRERVRKAVRARLRAASKAVARGDFRAADKHLIALTRRLDAAGVSLARNVDDCISKAEPGQ